MAHWIGQDIGIVWGAVAWLVGIGWLALALWMIGEALGRGRSGRRTKKKE